MYMILEVNTRWFTQLFKNILNFCQRFSFMVPENGGDFVFCGWIKCCFAQMIVVTRRRVKCIIPVAILKVKVTGRP